jgi:SSS family solute:Na+ symporter
MDLLQFVFGFVNAPLFATFLLGMFWKKATANGAFSGLVTGTVAAALTWGLTVAEGKGGVFGHVHTFPSVMAQNFWIAIFAFTSCFLVTVVGEPGHCAAPGERVGRAGIRVDEDSPRRERQVV